jgi:hypothetical protein
MAAVFYVVPWGGSLAQGGVTFSTLEEAVKRAHARRDATGKQYQVIKTEIVWPILIADLPKDGGA